MKYKNLGNSNLNVSKICLGTMTFGEQNSEKEAHDQLNYAVSQGVNFIDTAEMYPVPPRKETYSLTETYIGNWLKERGKRNDLIIATKVAGPSRDMKYVRNGSRLSRKQIYQAVDESLRRLQTDYIDLYQLHWPERTANFFSKLGFEPDPEETPVSLLESLTALDDLIKQGKIRYAGVSNETPWGTMKYLSHVKEHNLTKIISVQNPYNLLNRVYEIGLAEISYRENIDLLAYSPLAFGSLSGKYMNGQQPPNARLTIFKRFGRYLSEQGVSNTEKYCNIAIKYGIDPAKMALAFVNSRFFVGSNIIGATSIEQLKVDIDSINLQLSEEVIAEIEKVHEANSNPCP